ncbi:hypothetical protein TNCV_789711 [Trichonephila clavipes]|nr:hypothetical protein TNCV_789711 [Trichonephila clavipes]
MIIVRHSLHPSEDRKLSTSQAIEWTRPRFTISQLFKCCVKGILGAGGVMDKCVQMWTRNYDALGQTARVCFGVLCANQTREVKRDFYGRERRTRRPGRENGRKVGRGGRKESRGEREEKRGRVEYGRENGLKEKRERTEGVRDWSEKDDERRWR